MGWFGWTSTDDGEQVNVKVTHETLTTKTEVIKSNDDDRSNHSHEGITRNVFTGEEKTFSRGPKKER